MTHKVDWVSATDPVMLMNPLKNSGSALKCPEQSCDRAPNFGDCSEFGVDGKNTQKMLRKF